MAITEEDQAAQDGEKGSRTGGNTTTPTDGTTTTGTGGSNTQVSGLCQGDGECPSGFFCDFNNTTFVSSGDSTNQFGQCIPIPTPTPTPTPTSTETPPPPTPTSTETPPPTPTPTPTPTETPPPSLCQPGSFQCGPAVVLNGNTYIACCLNSDVCCPEGDGQFVCRPGPTCPVANECPPAGNLASCIGTRGDALLYTGQKDSNGVCATYRANSLECQQCPPQGQFLGCIGTWGDYSAGNIPGVFGCESYQVQNDPLCQPPPPEKCTPPNGPFQQTIEGSCVANNSNAYVAGNFTVVQSRTYTETNKTGPCPYTDWTTVSTDFSTCVPREDVPEGCTPPTDGFNRQIQVACTNLGSEFVGGIALQTQVRSYDSNGPTGTLCPYTQWVNSGIPDTSTCQSQPTVVISAPIISEPEEPAPIIPTPAPIIPTPVPIIPAPVTITIPAPAPCTAPAGPFTETSSIPCSQIDRKYTSGNATIRRVRKYDSSVQGPGFCPYTEWETTGTPDIALCREPVFWRNCVTGQLVEGNPPTTYTQSNFPQGGTCWEPQTDLGFIPSLSEALRYTYQRGSTKLPEPKTIKITNPSTTIAYAVKITTNQDITLSTDANQSGKGSIAFTIGPRSEIKLTVKVTQELLQQLQDGMSTLLVNVEYDRVLQ